MNKITFRAVFDRKKEADTGKSRGLVQIEVYFNRQRRYFSTGVRVFKNQWHSARQCVCKSALMNEYNKTIETYLGLCEKYKVYCLENDVQFSFEGLKHALEGSRSEDFVQFCYDRINQRTLRESSKKQQRSAIGTLVEFGGIKTFSDITLANITKYDEWLHKKFKVQVTIYSKHKVLRTYIREAVKFDRLGSCPYDKLSIGRGKPSEGKFMREEDMLKVEQANLPPVLEKVRDLMTVQFYTGLAYADLMTFSTEGIRDLNGTRLLIGRRMKTGVEYTIPLLDKVLSVLARHPNGLPTMSNVQYNLRIKAVCVAAGVANADKISSHWLRRGAGYWLLNNGVSMETVSRVLAHSSIRMTESIYAKLLPSTIVEDVKRHVGR